MRAALATALAAVLALASGCATTWTITQASGTQRIWDEHVREVDVPEPGITERLTIDMPVTTQYEPVAAPAAGTTTAPPAPLPPPKPLPFALACNVDQAAHDTVYHSAFRYGSFWKKSTAVFFLAEAASAAALLLAGDGQADDQVYGGALAIDAAVTGAIFFIPREEIYRREDRPISTHVRSDCPDGLALAIAGTEYPVDAAGRIGEVGDAALDDWMKRPAGPIEIHIAGASQPLPLGPDERCAWLRDKDHQTCPAASFPRGVTTSIVVRPGALVSALAF